MDLNEIIVFTRIVQAGSLTGAARLLGMPKSSVSQKLASLEDRLGARLLQRTTRKLGLTDAGRIYFERCVRIVSEIEEADQLLSQLEAGPRGLLRVTVPLSFGMLGPIVAAFLERHPDVQIEMVCTDRLVDLVEEGFDVAIRAGQLADSTLVARSLGEIRRVLVASPGYLKRRGTPRSLDDLGQHPCITFGASPTPGIWTLVSGEQKAAVRISPRLCVNDFEMMREAANAGLGIAWMTEFACSEDLSAGRLRHVLPEWRSEPTPIHALYPTTRHLSPKVVACVNWLRKSLRVTSSA